MALISVCLVFAELWVDRLDPKCRVPPNPYDACFEVVRKQNYAKEKATETRLPNLTLITLDPSKNSSTVFKRTKFLTGSHTDSLLIGS